MRLRAAHLLHADAGGSLAPRLRTPPLLDPQGQEDLGVTGRDHHLLEERVTAHSRPNPVELPRHRQPPDPGLPPREQPTKPAVAPNVVRRSGRLAIQRGRATTSLVTPAPTRLLAACQRTRRTSSKSTSRSHCCGKGSNMTSAFGRCSRLSTRCDSTYCRNVAWTLFGWYMDAAWMLHGRYMSTCDSTDCMDVTWTLHVNPPRLLLQEAPPQLDARDCSRRRALLAAAHVPRTSHHARHAAHRTTRRTTHGSTTPPGRLDVTLT